MLIQVHRVDKDGFYMEPVLIEQNNVIEDENIVTIDPPEGLYKPRWLDGEWVEGLTPEEIEEIKKPIPKVPSEIDILGKQLAEKELQILQLQADTELFGQQVAEKDIQIMSLQSENEMIGQQLVDKDLRLIQVEVANEKMGQSIVNLELKLMNMEGK